MSMRVSLSCALLLVAAPVWAWPVDWIHDVAPGKEKFIPLPALDWFEVDDPKVVSVEWFPETNELLVSGLKPGRALVLLGANGKVAAWLVRVGTPSVSDASALLQATQRCPGLKLTPLEDVKLSVAVADEPCRQSLLTLFQTDAFDARGLELTFDSKALQAQLVSIQEGVRRSGNATVKARYVGAGLVLEGAVTPAEHHRVFWEVLRRSVGRFALDDQLKVLAPDAGSDSK